VIFTAGLTIFDHVCAQCHDAPGKAPDAFAEGVNPNPQPWRRWQVCREWSLQQIYLRTLHGVKMTGMPAFEFRMPDGPRRRSSNTFLI
jgi:mono/diheme cytochrome c family protein